MSDANREGSDPSSFLPLHPLELRILLVVGPGPAHGYRIVKEIESQETDLKPLYPANLYRRIRDLLAKGLLLEVSPPEEGGVDPRRKYYQVTSLGLSVVKAETSRMESLIRDARALGALQGN